MEFVRLTFKLRHVLFLQAGPQSDPDMKAHLRSTMGYGSKPIEAEDFFRCVGCISSLVNS